MPKLRVAISVLVGLILAPFLPLYLRSIMTRSFRQSGGDAISWGWELQTLPSFIDKMQYMRPEEHALAYLAGNLVLALVLATMLALGVWFGWGAIARRRP